MNAMGGRFATLRSHWDVLKESWARQNGLDRQAVDRSDHEFLPAALEIMERPPSRGGRMLLLTLCALFAGALLWAFVGRVDVVAVAPGKTIASGNSKIVQPMQLGSVRAVHVRDGDFVRAGQLLVELDPTIANAQSDQSGQALLSAELADARNRAILGWLSGKGATFDAPPGAPADLVATQQMMVRTAIASFEAERASLLEQRAQRSAELQAAHAEIAKLENTLPYLEDQIAARRKLSEQGYFSKLKLLEYEQGRVEHVSNIAVQRSAVARAAASIRDLDAQVKKLRESFERTAAGELAEASDRVGTARGEVRKADEVRRLLELRSPVDGVVQQLAVNSIGGVVQPAQPLMVIVPCTGERSADCRSEVEIEAMVANRDIGFVHPGQRVVVKFEAFNFTDYGFIEGRVRTISRDAMSVADQSGQKGGPSGAAAPLAPVYVARIDLECDSTPRALLCAKVSTGMAVQAEIVTGSRRIVDFLLSPLAKAVKESGRER